MKSQDPSIPSLLMQLQGTLAEALAAGLPAEGFEDIRPPHCQVLRRVEPAGSRLTDLASAAKMTKQSMGALVDHLEAGGYLERVAHHGDGRVKLIRLTPRGRRAATAIGAIGERIEQEWAERIGRQRLEQLRAALIGIAADTPA